MFHTLPFLVFFTFFSFNYTFAFKNDCLQHYHQQTTPKISETSLTISEICLAGFTVGYAHQIRMPLWSAEYLTRDRLKIADTLSRTDYFHEETSLPKASQANLEEFKHYGYDRGHLAPHHDMASEQSQYDSFSLANIVLQNSTHNRKYWSAIERLTRYQVYLHDDAYVVTGVLIKNSEITESGLLIPTHLFKAVYLPKLNKAGVYVSENTDVNHTNVISLSEFAKLSGIDVFPSLDDSIKQHTLQLPVDSNSPNITNNNTTTENDDDISAIINFFIALFHAFIKLFN